MKSDPSAGQVRSVAKSLELLETLLARRAPMTLQELSDAVGYPKSTVHALLSTLRAHAMVTQGADGRYALGVRLFECGCAVSEGWDVSRVARPYLEELAAATGGSAFLSLLEGDYVITFDQCTGASGVQVVPEVGIRLPAHATSQGKLLLSLLSDSEIRMRAQRTGLPPYTPHTITDTDALLEAAAEVRRNGYAVENGEYRIGLRAVAAPVRDRTGQVRYALGAVGFFDRVWTEAFHAVIAQTLREAALLQSALGWNARM